MVVEPASSNLAASWSRDTLADRQKLSKHCRTWADSVTLAGMGRGLRRVLWLVAGVQAMLAVGFAFELRWALGVWPFGGED